ncbi:MAG: isoprenylcysteine carboxylmethyltransferase family protein [Gemmatimonadales bacterium]
MTTEAQLANPGVKFPPPSLFLAGFGVAWLLETYVRRIPILRIGHTTTMEVLGTILIVLGFVMMFWGMLTFARAKTAILPIRPASRIVDHGPYSFTRNPMYVGMSLAYFGGAFVMNSVWALILFPFVIALLSSLVIAREERYLSSAFGDDYDDYRKRVRRWL